MNIIAFSGSLRKKSNNTAPFESGVRACSGGHENRDRRCEIVGDKQKTEVNGILIEGFGTEHGKVYENQPDVENTGYFIGNKLFYPGDSFYNPGKHADIFALPVGCPWLKLQEALLYAKEMKPRIAFPVHDGLFNDYGLAAAHRWPSVVLEKLGVNFVAMKEGSIENSDMEPQASQNVKYSHSPSTSCLYVPIGTRTQCYTSVMREQGNKKQTSLEQKVRSRARRGSIERAIIGTLAVGGMLTIAMMAPKVLSLLKREHFDYILPPNPKQRLRETISRMKRKGWIKFEESNGKRYLRLSALGQQQIGRISLGALSIRKPFRWDRRWRMVVFDIEEARQNDRKKIRRLLQHLNFLQLQRSVWIHPYDCEEIIALIKTDMRIGRNVLYVIADAIEYDRPLRQHFRLPID